MDKSLLILDQKILDDLIVHIGEDSVVFLIGKMKDEIRSSEDQLQAFADAGDMRGLENTAHGLKSAARSFGAMQLGELCSKLETSAKSAAPIEEIEQLLLQFKDIAKATIRSYD